MSNSESVNGRGDEESPSKAETNNSDDESSSDKDSPAFRLRPRRSTPRPSSSASNPSSVKKYSYLSPKESPVYQNRGASLKYKPVSPVKRKLFRFFSTNDSEDDSRFSTPLSPSKCVREDINVSAFAERLLLKQLDVSKSYESNYVFVKIVHIFNDMEKENTDDVLKLIAQEADGSGDLGKSSDNIIVTLFGHYSNLPNLAVGKYLQIFKFKTEEIVKRESRIDECDIETLPFSLIVKNTKDPVWVPFVSVKSSFEPPADQSVLSVHMQRNFLSSSSSPKHKGSEMSSSTEKKPSPEVAPVSVSIKQGTVSKVSVKNPEVNFKNYFSSTKFKDVRQVPAPTLRSSCVKSKATSITITSSSVTINSKNASLND